MRTTHLAGTVLAAGLLAACSSGPEGDAPQEPPKRTAPAKSVDLPDKCAAIPEAQWRTLGAGDSGSFDYDGRPGCRYASGDTVQGSWTVIVVPDPANPMSKLVQDKGLQPAVSRTIAGYPATEAKLAQDNCVTVLDVADDGNLTVRAQINDGGADPCQLAQQFVEAAVPNLPPA